MVKLVRVYGVRTWMGGRVYGRLILLSGERWPVYETEHGVFVSNKWPRGWEKNPDAFKSTLSESRN